ncbi:MAG TPA: LacI family DNA-binding transcriptional regulator, partial [Fimbriimonadaceae bacterium]|nr:LacI family DNA-binding transcriptional regulator [Fimbriimonadaceae bacterium]
MTRRVTLRELAKEAGVSVCTASVVLNGSRSSSQISSDTRRALQDLARARGYRPNRTARSLRGGRTQTIGVVPAFVDQNMLLGPHLQLVMNAAANTLAEAHYDLLLLTRYDQAMIDPLLDAILGGRLDAVMLVSPRTDCRLSQRLSEAGFPYVVVDGAPDADDRTFAVDNAAGVELALRHLLDLGHRRIAHITGRDNIPVARLRHRAFEEILAREGLD